MDLLDPRHGYDITGVASEAKLYAYSVLAVRLPATLEAQADGNDLTSLSINFV